MKRRFATHDKTDKGKTAGTADADAEAFGRALADVVRLPPDPRGRVRVAQLVVARRAASPSPSTAAGEAIDDESETSFVASGVDRRELRKLNRGDHPPGSRLDLHGQTATEAVAAVKQFIDTGRHRHRCVCIVHGRGLHSYGGVSVLKTHVRACLRRHPAVLAYTDAPRADGGAGAVYVLLRK